MCLTLSGQSLVCFNQFLICLQAEMPDGPAAKKRKTTSEFDDGSFFSTSSYNFPSMKISAERIASSQPLHCRFITGHHSDGAVNAVEFSDDSSFFVSGGSDGRVLSWPSRKVDDEKWTPKAKKMSTKQSFAWS